MQTIEELLAQAPAFRRMSAEHRQLIAGCGRTAVFGPGEYLLREGDPSDAFYVLRRGTVALETTVPQRGPVTLQTLEEGDLLGWSWLFPPYRTAFDARAVDSTHTVMFDGACLRRKCDADPGLGYDLHRLFAHLVIQRLQHTLLQLADIYGTVAGS